MTYSVESPSPEFNLYIPTVPFQSVPVETSSSPAANPPPDLIGIGGGTCLGSPGLVPGLSNGFSGSQVHIISSSSPVPTQSNLSGSGSVTSYYGSTSQLHTVSPTAPPFIPKTNYPNGKWLVSPKKKIVNKKIVTHILECRPFRFPFSHTRCL